MEKLGLIDLNLQELINIEGGSELAEGLTYLIGVMGAYMKSAHHVRSQYDLIAMGH
ncbi:hypothetical protein [Flavobacterium xanthum]|uniref:Uncharacterized protein n=1 Tax=Flavobacterium xanthum TaxID=69322 RepID=A0A1M7FY04_9FLAO|nr:hypothetical protein [Flavobacterium xanthum]SHM08876.1 hypothetical protein SAMN05443669_102180 [Flavobacterium xanthum]